MGADNVLWPDPLLWRRLSAWYHDKVFTVMQYNTDMPVPGEFAVIGLLEGGCPCDYAGKDSDVACIVCCCEQQCKQ